MTDAEQQLVRDREAERAALDDSRRSRTSTTRRGCRPSDARTIRAIYALLTEFDRLTGCPVLVNTVFNVRGEPIVCTPEDAYRCFMRTGIDTLVLDNFLLDKSRAAGRCRTTLNGRRNFSLIEIGDVTVAEARKSTLVVAGVLALVSAWQLYRGRSTAAAVLGATVACCWCAGPSRPRPHCFTNGGWRSPASSATSTAG